MTSLMERPPTARPPRNGSAMRRAWYALLLLPVSFLAAFVVAAVLYSAVGHDPSSETPPHGADAVALIPAGLVFVVPAVFAVVYGRRAAKAGHRAGNIPAGIAIAATLGYAVLNVL